MKLISPELKLVQQIPILRPNSEVFLSPSYISNVDSQPADAFTLILAGKKLLYSLEIEFGPSPNPNEALYESLASKNLQKIQWRLTNFQKKSKKSVSFSACLAINENSVLVGGFDGTLSILDMREKFIAKLNKIHLDAVHHLQKVQNSGTNQTDGE